MSRILGRLNVSCGRTFSGTDSPHRYTFPIPIPASHTFFLSEVDYKDGFVHLSTAEQVPGTLDRFFGDVESVTLLRLELDRVAAFKRIRWEESSHGGSEWSGPVPTWRAASYMPRRRKAWAELMR